MPDRNACSEYDGRILDQVFVPCSDSELEAHLSSCKPCQGSRDAYLRTVEAIHGALAIEAPVPVQRKQISQRPMLRPLGIAAALATAAATIAFLVFASDEGKGEKLKVPGLLRTRYVADMRPISVPTAAGLVRCERGVFTLEVVPDPSGRSESDAMKRGAQAAMLVTVAVVSGAVIWERSTGDEFLSEGMRATRAAASSEIGFPKSELSRKPILELTSKSFDPSREVPPASPRTLVVQVFEGQDRPVAGARVLAFSGEEIHDDVLTGGDGIAVVQRPDTPSDLLVFAKKRAPVLVTIRADVERETVRLSDVVAVQGRLECTNGPLPEALDLKLLFHVLPDYAVLPPTVARRLEETKTHYHSSETSIEKDGSFEFVGFPTGKKASLRLSSSHYAFANPVQPHRVDITTPASGLNLRIRKVPVITGRVLNGGEPLPQADIELAVEVPGQTIVSSTTTDSDGRWTFRIVETEVRGLVVSALNPRGGGRVRLERKGAVESDLNLGDLKLVDGRMLAIRVVSKDDLQPAREAYAKFQRTFATVAMDRGEDGELELQLDAGTPWIVVGALGHRAERVQLPDVWPSKLEVRLERTNQVRLVLRTEQGEVPEEVTVSVTVHSPHAEPELADFGGAELRGIASGGTKGRWRLAPTPLGVVVLSDLLAAVDHEVRLHDRLGSVFQTCFFRVGASEKLDFPIIVSAPARNVTLKVVAESGEAVSRAGVSWRSEGEENLHFKFTRADGTLLLEQIRAEKARLRVYVPGYALLVVSEFPILSAPKPPDLVLVRGRTVRVAVVDSRNSPVPGAWVDFLAGSERPEFEGEDLAVGQRTNDLGETSFADLPSGVLTLSVLHGPLRIEQAVDTALSEMRVVLPPLGSARFLFGERHALGATYRIRLIPLFEGAQERNEWMMPGDLSEKRETKVTELAPGKYTVTLIDYGDGKRPSVEASKVEVEVLAHEVVTVVL